MLGKSYVRQPFFVSLACKKFIFQESRKQSSRSSFFHQNLTGSTYGQSQHLFKISGATDYPSQKKSAPNKLRYWNNQLVHVLNERSVNKTSLT